MNPLLSPLYIYADFVPTFFRLIIATLLLFQTWCLINESQHSSVRKVLFEIFSPDYYEAMRILLSGLRVAVAIMLLLGTSVQVAAIMASILFALRMASHTYRDELMTTDLLLIIISLSLIFLGPGAFSINNLN